MADPRPRRQPIGGAGGPGAGAVAPAANEGEAGPAWADPQGPPQLRPNGGARGGLPVGRGAAPPAANGERAWPGSARQRAPLPPGTSALGCSGLLGLRFQVRSAVSVSRTCWKYRFQPRLGELKL